MTTRLHIAIRGTVQGVGFRPFVYRLATELRLGGRVFNSPQGVFIDAEGPKDILDTFLLRLGAEKPPLASIQSMEFAFLDPRGDAIFQIAVSSSEGEAGALVLPDIAPCPACLAEIIDPSNRRHLYPFTNCTNCGPRFTIIESLPYDRARTSMKAFPMCDACRREYEDPTDRRFHAQPTACPVCGPQLALWDERGNPIARGHGALIRAAERIRAGGIVALKGLGGFHLIADARNDESLRRLRQRKHREEKPFALMAPHTRWVLATCQVSPLEERLLNSPEAPIVLMRKRSGEGEGGDESQVAPDNPYLGVMLPSTPLHHLLMRELAFPVVATSGNLSDEPICIDEHEALQRLRGIADEFLVHNRPIVRHADDSIARVMLGRELIMRRARGFSPLPVTLGTPMADTLAVGAHLKNTVAVSKGRNVFISQHIGDLTSKQSLDAFRTALADMQGMFNVAPKSVVSDLHPDYLSTQFARASGLPHELVQHHYAHVASCMAENGLEGRVLGVPWDGTGYGTDGTVWGGEFLLTTPRGFERVASLRPFRLPGGDEAVREPRRSAVGLLFELLGPGICDRTDLPSVRAFSGTELFTIRRMLERGVNAPFTSSAGRLFDAVASLAGVRQVSTYEGQAAMAMEYLLQSTATDDAYAFRIVDQPGGEKPNTPDTPRYLLDWSDVVLGLLDDVRSATPPGLISARLHNGLVEAIIGIAKVAGEKRVVLSGGCFQNRYLTERTVHRLREEGFQPYWHQRIPPNDGGIALGQMFVARQSADRRKEE